MSLRSVTLPQSRTPIEDRGGGSAAIEGIYSRRLTCRIVDSLDGVTLAQSTGQDGREGVGNATLSQLVLHHLLVLLLLVVRGEAVDLIVGRVEVGVAVHQRRTEIVSRHTLAFSHTSTETSSG